MIKLNLPSVAWLLLGGIAACSQIPEDAYKSRSKPENLLVEQAGEKHFLLSSSRADEKILKAVKFTSHPSVTLYCEETSKACNRLERNLKKEHIAFTRTNSHRNSVTLKYTSYKARDCDNRYVDNIVNPYNLNHPTFGCSVTANTVQMVTNRKELIDPALMGSADGRKAVQSSDNYMTAPKADTNFQPITTSETLSSSGGGGGGSR